MLQQFQSTRDGDSVYNLLQQQTEELEYDYYALCVRHPVPFTRPKLTLQSTYPQAWMSHYQAENYFAIDCRIMHWDSYRFLLKTRNRARIRRMN